MTALRVLTETSAYLVDNDEGFIIREPGAGAGGVDFLPAPETVGLRRDGDRIPLLEPATPVVGQRMVLLLDVRGDGVTTIRTTTIVREITEVPA